MGLLAGEGRPPRFRLIQWGRAMDEGSQTEDSDVTEGPGPRRGSDCHDRRGPVNARDVVGVEVRCAHRLGVFLPERDAT